MNCSVGIKASEIKASKLIAQAWLDPAFHESLMIDPSAALAEAGLTLSDIASVDCNISSDVAIALPQRPTSLSDDDLKQYTSISGACGFCRGCGSC